MPLKDILKRHKNDGQADERSSSATDAEPPQQQENPVPEFTFKRTTTSTEEIIAPPTYPEDEKTYQAQTGPKELSSSSAPRRFSFRRQSRGAQAPQDASAERSSPESSNNKHDKRLSERLHLSGHHSRSASSSSTNLPADLPEIQAPAGQNEEEWEKRATILAKSNPNQEGIARPSGLERSLSREQIAEDDVDIQEAIRLHEAGDLGKSTAMFGKLADPKGENNALSQVLYGLALRHGWGIEKDETKAVTYLSLAASNSADIETLALQAGMKKGGQAKGELTLAIFELANCFRNGWGVSKDPVAAKQYYETAANLGDVDAMNEIAWCYLEGFGCKKDKFRAAQYLRLAEEKGSKTVGNSWIWKDKYGGPKKN